MPDGHRVYSYSAVLMGSPILLKLFSHDEALASRVFRLIRHYEDLFTVNRAQSEVMAINHAAGLYPVTVSRPVFELIRCARAASLLKNSAFNLAIGPLVKRWKIGFKGDSVPPADDIAALLAITRPQEVVLDETDSSVFLTKAGMEIDLGAIAKGYIADRVRDYLQKEGAERGLINLGGNIQTLGSPEGGWSVGLKKPFSTDALIGAIVVENRSVVTSGTYERYFEQNGTTFLTRVPATRWTTRWTASPWCRKIPWMAISGPRCYTGWVQKKAARRCVRATSPRACFSRWAQRAVTAWTGSISFSLRPCLSQR